MSPTCVRQKIHLSRYNDLTRTRHGLTGAFMIHDAGCLTARQKQVHINHALSRQHMSRLALNPVRNRLTRASGFGVGSQGSSHFTFSYVSLRSSPIHMSEYTQRQGDYPQRVTSAALNAPFSSPAAFSESGLSACKHQLHHDSPNNPFLHPSIPPSTHTKISCFLINITPTSPPSSSRLHPPVALFRLEHRPTRKRAVSWKT